MPTTVILHTAVLITGVLAIAGCSGASESGGSGDAGAPKVAVPVESLDAELDRLDPALRIVPSPADNPTSYMLSFSVWAGGNSGSAHMQALTRIRRVAFVVHRADGSTIDSLSTEEVITSGVQNAETNSSSLTASADVTWTGTPPDGAYVVAWAYTDSGMVARRTAFDAGFGDESFSGPSIQMYIEAKPIGSGVNFVLHAERATPMPEGEHLKGRQQFIIELQNQVGETIWSTAPNVGSDKDRGGIVEPDQVGERKEFVAFWDGRSDLTHSRLEPGTYRIIGTIPAEPEPYIIREEFNWSGR